MQVKTEYEIIVDKIDNAFKYDNDNIEEQIMVDDTKTIGTLHIMESSFRIDPFLLKAIFKYSEQYIDSVYEVPRELIIDTLGDYFNDLVNMTTSFYDYKGEEKEFECIVNSTYRDDIIVTLKQSKREDY